jgi:hypothetical protein
MLVTNAFFPAYAVCNMFVPPTYLLTHVNIIQCFCVCCLSSPLPIFIFVFIFSYSSLDYIDCLLTLLICFVPPQRFRVPVYDVCAFLYACNLIHIVGHDVNWYVSLCFVW